MVIQSLEDWNILESQLEQQKKSASLAVFEFHMWKSGTTFRSGGQVTTNTIPSQKKIINKINLISSKHFYSFSFLLFFDYILRIYIVEAKKLTLMRRCILPNLSLQISAYKYQIQQNVHKILIGLFQNTCEVLLS